VMLVFLRWRKRGRANEPFRTTSRRVGFLSSNLPGVAMVRVQRVVLELGEPYYTEIGAILHKWATLEYLLPEHHLARDGVG